MQTAPTQIQMVQPPQIQSVQDTLPPEKADEEIQMAQPPQLQSVQAAAEDTPTPAASTDAQISVGQQDHTRLKFQIGDRVTCGKDCAEVIAVDSGRKFGSVQIRYRSGCEQWEKENDIHFDFHCVLKAAAKSACAEDWTVLTRQFCELSGSSSLVCMTSIHRKRT
jgi:hypothetical protein